jgi:hypothetical protein
MSGSGTPVDDQTGVLFVYVGHSEDENSKSGKHGVGFLMSWKARGLWTAQGSQVNRVSARVLSVSMTLVDEHKKEVPFFFLQGRAAQQNCSEEERNVFWLDAQAALDQSPKGATKVLLGVPGGQPPPRGPV